VDENVREREVSQALTITFGVFFWIMVLALFALAIYRMID